MTEGMCDGGRRSTAFSVTGGNVTGGLACRCLAYASPPSLRSGGGSVRLCLIYVFGFLLLLTRNGRAVGGC